MSLQQSFEAHRSEIKAQVLHASEHVSLRTEIKRLTSGALIITQPSSAVALTPSQVADLMAQIGAQVTA